MAAAPVTYSNLFSEARNNILVLISDKTKVADPTISSAEFRKWIHAREPDVNADEFKGYPFIIVHPVDFRPAEGGSVNGKSKQVSWTQEIEVVTSDRGYGNKNGMGLAHMDAISDDIMTMLLDMTNRKTLSANGLYFVRPETTNVVPEMIKGELCFRRSILVNFGCRFRVSA